MQTTQPTTNPIPRVPDRMRTDGWWLVSEPARRRAVTKPESVVVSATEDRADDYRQHHDSYRRADWR